MAWYDYEQRQFDELKFNFDINKLKEEATYAQREINNLEEKILHIRKYIQAVTEQAQKVLNTDFYYEVYYKRYKRSYGDKKVSIYVGCDHKPKTEIVNPRVKNIGHKMFGGNEKKQAREYAQELARKNNCKIILTGCDKM